MSISTIDVAGTSPSENRVHGSRWPSFGSGRAGRTPRPAGPVAGGAPVEDRGGLADARSQRFGLRLLRVAVLLACYFILELAVKAVMILQLLFVAWRKRPHAGLQSAGSMLAQYMKDLWGYCTFASDRAPWPFSPWPRGQPDASA